MVERFKTHLFKSKFASNKNFTRPDLSDQIFFGKTLDCTIYMTRFYHASELLLVDDLVILIQCTPMNDISNL